MNQNLTHFQKMMKILNKKEEVRCRTVGYFIKEDSFAVYIALSITDDHDSANSIKQILKSDILHIQGLIL